MVVCICVIGNIVNDIGISIDPRCESICCIPGIPIRKHAIIIVLRESTIPTDGPEERGMYHQASIMNCNAFAEELGCLDTCAYRLLGEGISLGRTSDLHISPSIYPLGPGSFEVLNFEMDLAFVADDINLVHIYDELVFGTI